MNKSYFPMFVDLSEKKILVAGGGRIAARRVETLLLFAKHITVVSPKLCDTLAGLAGQGTVEYRKRCWREDDLAGCDIVLAATNDKAVNHRIWEAATANGILVNVADDKSRCDFFFPAVVTCDDMVVGISSGGRDPGKVRKLREKIGGMNLFI